MPGMRLLRLVPAAMLLLAPAVIADEPDPAKIARGREIYDENRCRLCHSVEGKGNPNGKHDGVGSRLTADEIRDWITKPDEMAKKRKATRKPAMASFDFLDEKDLDALVAYLQSLK